MTSRHLRPVLTALGVLLAAGLTGCGGSSGSDDAAAPAGGGTSASSADATSPTEDVEDTDDGGGSGGDAPDPCSLTSAADLSEVYGVSFGEGTPDNSGPAAARGFKVCKWVDAGGTKSYVLQTVAGGDDLGQSAADLFDESAALYPGSTDGGVGDKSILLPDEGGFLAVQGDVFVQGNPIVIGGETPAGASKTVLEAVVGKLG
ncbi:hypothetical protein ACXR2U_10715 [Jatrophihabitans sp. YIM 134969]